VCGGEVECSQGESQDYRKAGSRLQRWKRRCKLKTAAARRRRRRGRKGRRRLCRRPAKKKAKEEKREEKEDQGNLSPELML
jgi:hypothetical protein